MLRTTTALCAALVLAACAQSPSSIEPVSMGAAYEGVDCDRAFIERRTSAIKLTSLSTQQRGAVAGDAVGVFLLGIPMASLTGGDVSGQIALEKGKIASLDARLLGCPAI